MVSLRHFFLVLALALAAVQAAVLSPVSRSSSSHSDKLVDSIVGYYENIKFSGSGKNNWHYVDIEKVDQSTLRWVNRAGRQWTLSVISDAGVVDTDKLQVGTDCPYYSSGYTEAAIVRDANTGEISAIVGPGDEAYLRFPGAASQLVDSLIGHYENLKYTGSGKNNWHYVDVEKVDHSTLRWTNRAGVSWTLYIQDAGNGVNTDSLIVGSDCPYYKSGYTAAGIVRDEETGLVSAILGPGGEAYNRFPGTGSEVVASVVGSYENLLYSGSGKNNWHFVQIEKVNNSTLRWTNSAGVKWTLYVRSVGGKVDTENLVVGADSPYHSRGHTIAKIERDSKSGMVTAIRGPGNEAYTRDATSSAEIVASVVGTFENLLYTGSGKNNWHYVEIEKVDESTVRWKNRAGRSWTLSVITSDGKVDTTKLSVGTDCPYYSRGYTQAELVRDADTGAIRKVIGPGSEPYTRQY
ncbi:hypothetical protein BWQ96_08619 [Gracilariopsis chorda]|uniref:Uncharacterized protein n=1 Tax=Gracilariopsis chorda TaxID=448386 RepID=A0A2V3II04_9FLOR|nr:hypothetical protein BWQ96_08619 [Gracilariopsis chorda]|eukprot:PXF41668.1 hypothetical protein BWQ96_08619 [Gracilariopsis chorda]